MLEYADADPIHKMHNTCLVLIEGSEYARYDCYFEHYTEHPSLLNKGINERVSFSDEQSEVMTTFLVNTKVSYHNLFIWKIIINIIFDKK
jgi:hypothetical protein